MPCKPLDISNVQPPDTPSFSGPVGKPFTPILDKLSSEDKPKQIDLQELYDILQYIVPPGVQVKTVQSKNYGQDAFDFILGLMDKVYPFLLLYNFFLPLLNIIICIIEVLCAIPDPFKTVDALIHLFRDCIPAFLALFPIFALAIMIISLCLLLLALIEYIYLQIFNFIKSVIDNIYIIGHAFDQADADSILACLRKFGNLFCQLQNLFLILSLFTAILNIIESILQLAFKIPPCDDSVCCNDCSSFIKHNEQISSKTGKLQYFNKVNYVNNSITLPDGSHAVINTERPEAWQFYDPSIARELAPINITSPYDISISSPYFPTSVSINKNTSLRDVPYTVDLRLKYNPSAHAWDNTDMKGKRFIKIKNCIVTNEPHENLYNYQNLPTLQQNGVLNLVGGLFYEDDGTTPILINGVQASLETFLHVNPEEFSTLPIPFYQSDAYTFTNIEYTLKINHKALVKYSIIPLGCVPAISKNKAFVAATLKPPFKITLPNVTNTQNCLAVATDALKFNLSLDSVAIFQATTTACLSDLQNQIYSSLNNLITNAYNQYKSTFSINPNTQFTSRKIQISVQLKDTNGAPLLNVPVTPDFAAKLASQINAIVTLGTVEKFVYDNSGNFISNISSTEGGDGTIKISFDGKIISDLIVPQDITIDPTIQERVLNYKFIYSPVAPAGGASIGDTFGTPIRDETDTSRGV